MTHFMPIQTPMSLNATHAYDFQYTKHINLLLENLPLNDSGEKGVKRGEKNSGQRNIKDGWKQSHSVY